MCIVVRKNVVEALSTSRRTSVGGSVEVKNFSVLFDKSLKGYNAWRTVAAVIDFVESG